MTGLAGWQDAIKDEVRRSSSTEVAPMYTSFAEKE